MYGKFFGHFLRENKVVTNSQLKRLLEVQKQERSPLGVIAVEFGFLSASQVQDIVKRQQESDKRFGETAVEMGLLTEEQIGQLTKVQIEQHMLIGQLAVEQGFLDITTLESLLDRFHKENTRLESEIQRAIEDSIAPMVFKNALWTVQRFFSRVFHGTVKGVDCLETIPVAGRLDQVFTLYLDCPGQGTFGHGIILRKPLVYSLIYCLLGRETSSEKLIRETLHEFAWDLLKSEVNSLKREGVDSSPHGVDTRSEITEQSVNDPLAILLDGPTGPFPLVLFRPSWPEDSE